jgi:hypothetical protein
MARVVGRQRPLWLGLSEERKLAKFLIDAHRIAGRALQLC